MAITVLKPIGPPRVQSARRATRREVREYEGHVTIYIDSAVLDEFRARAEQAETGYQSMMNEALKGYLAISEAPVTESVLRRVGHRISGQATL